ncbi:MAG: glycosyltransferase involved in cell wall biosynthesis [Hyphomicrobiaceae bacterium]|jgi:glycosyltransferase involved in cell wall biosynthesis
MLFGKKIVVVMPAYNAAPTLRQTYSEIPFDYVDAAVLVDDGSSDETVELARSLGATTLVHLENKGYGGNQKTCYREALRLGADVVVMLHPDYQYTPNLLVAMSSMIAIGEYDCVLGSRVLCQSAISGGMPVYKYVANRALTFFENIMLRQHLSEYHTGYRAFSREVLETLPLEENSDDFVFDNQMLAQCIHFGFRMGEVSCPTKYFEDASSINFSRSVTYGLGVLATSVAFRLNRMGLIKSDIFRADGERLALDHQSHVHVHGEVEEGA